MNKKTATKIVFNGREYASADELPPELRAQYDRLMNTVDADHNGVPDALEGDAAAPSVSVADSAVARLAMRLMPADRRARYEAALREADIRLDGDPGALDFGSVGEFASQVTAQTQAQPLPVEPAPSDEDAAISWLEGLAQKQVARPPQTPAPTQSPANFPVVSAEPPRSRRWLFFALVALLIVLAGVAGLALLILVQAGPR
jgi:hypothetical protein